MYIYVSMYGTSIWTGDKLVVHRGEFQWTRRNVQPRVKRAWVPARQRLSYD